MAHTVRAALFLFLMSTGVASAEGILPGEPDPNTGPRSDAATMNDGNHDRVLIDDRIKCPHGTKRFQKMKCGKPGSNPECQNYSPVLECHQKTPALKCRKPQVPVPVYRCE